MGTAYACPRPTYVAVACYVYARDLKPLCRQPELNNTVSATMPDAVTDANKADGVNYDGE